MKKIILGLLLVSTLTMAQEVTQVKYFINKTVFGKFWSSSSKLEENMNKWLSQHKDIKVVDIKLQDNDEHTSGMIIYTVEVK